MARDNGGVIGVLNTPSTTTASGVWALQDQYEAKRNGTWPLTPFVSPNSLRFNSGSSDYLFKNSWATATSDKIFTYSTWVKRSQLGSTERLFGAYAGSPQVYSCDLSFTSNNGYIEFTFGGASAYDIVTNAMFRDISAWYHVVLSVDTTQATASDRIKIYVNSTLQTLQTANYPPQNTTYQVFRNNNANLIGSAWNGGAYYTGYMSEVYFIDGQALTPSSFGASNASGVWYPIPYSGTYGNNGFYLKFGNASSLGTDSSPNGNNFTVNNLTSVDQSTDSTLNNFSTLNPLNVPTTNAPTFTEGNLQTAITSTGYYGGNSSIMASAGKWYAEFKMTAASLTGNFMMGVDNAMSVTARNNVFAGASSSPTGYSIYGGDGYLYNNSTNIPYGTSYTTNDIISIALDLDNNKLYLAKNGTWMNSGVPTSGATGTGAIAITASSSTIDGGYTFSIGDGGSAYTATVQANFGSPPYAANSFADGNGYGNFSYAVPSGYYALCTANLNTYG